MLAIAHRISNDNGTAFPGVAKICKEANLSERQVQASIQNLKKMGELEVKIGASELGTNIYKMPKFLLWMKNLHPTNSTPAKSAPPHKLPPQKTPVPPQTVHEQYAPEPSLESLTINSEPSSRLDDLKKSFLAKCVDPRGTIAAMVEIVCRRAEKSGVVIKTETYLEKALENFDTRSGKDSEELSEFMHQGTFG